MENSEGVKLWKNFDHFAVYEDMKDLYQKTIPQISKFDDKLNSFKVELNQEKEIMRRFDEILCTKATRTAMESQFIEVYEVVATKTELKEWKEQVEKT